MINSGMKLFLALSLPATFVLTPSYAPSYAEELEPEDELGIEEKLGSYIPLELSFYDEEGRKNTLGELIDEPAIISLVYYNCKRLCPTTLDGLSEVLGKLGPAAGEDYRVITVSFDPRDTPEVALRRKTDYIKAIGKPFPPGAWRFLTGDPGAIGKLTSSLGFKYRSEGEDFLHPGALVVASPEGKVVRYLYGKRFLPFEVEMALAEASAGRPASAVRSALLFCFSYDPQGRRYVFNLLKVTGTVTLLTALAFFIFLKKTTRA